MSAYVDIGYVKLVGSMPAADVDAVEALYPGTVDGVATAVSRMFDGALSKRYAAPFADPPEVVKWQVAQVVVYALFMKRGFNPSSMQDTLVQKNRDDALTWLREAADSKDGLIELPAREADPSGDGIVKAGPLGYFETSPYVWTDIQETDGRADDGG